MNHPYRDTILYSEFEFTNLVPWAMRLRITATIVPILPETSYTRKINTGYDINEHGRVYSYCEAFRKRYKLPHPLPRLPFED